MGDKIRLHDLKQMEKEARRKLILDAAIELFSSQPVSNVGIRDIATKAEVSPALIYQHFKGRDELFVEAFIKQSEKMISEFEDQMAQNGTRSLEDIGEVFVNYLLDHDDFFQMMTHFMLDTVMKEDAVYDFNETMRRLLVLFDNAFQHNGTNENVRFHSQALFSALNGIVITYRNYPGRSEEETRDQIMRLTKLITSKFE